MHTLISTVPAMLAILLLANPGTALAAGSKKAAPPPAPAVQTSPEPAPAECADGQTSIVVKLRYPNGEREEYRRELDSMELVFDDAGRPALIHLILYGGPEKDTHKWIQVQSLSNFSYRFCNVSGKGKVRLSVLQPFYREGSAPSTKGNGMPAPELPAVNPKDYR